MSDLPRDEAGERSGLRVLVCAPRGSRDTRELVGRALAEHIDLVVVPVERLPEGFFQLSTGVAGKVIQQFVNYRVRLAVVGDISGHVERSSALRDFVQESSQGRHVWFLTDLAELDEELERVSGHEPDV